MKEQIAGKANLSIVSEKEIYAFLSETIYDELKEYGAEAEYILAFMFYLHWVVVREYTRVSPNDLVYTTRRILDKVQTSPDTTEAVDTFFESNSEILFSIYNEIYEEGEPLMWLRKWQQLCISFYATNPSKLETCVTLLQIVNESLGMPHDKTTVSLNLLLKIQKSKLQRRNLTDHSSNPKSPE